MKNTFITLLFALPLSLPAQTATVTINTNRIIGAIDPNILMNAVNSIINNKK